MQKSIFILFVLFFTGQVFAVVINVPGDYPTIQQGINAAGPNDIVMVAAGIYIEEITLKADVSVIGAGEGLSIIDGGGNAGDVVTAVGASITNTTKFQGFSVTGAISGGSMPGGAGIFCNMSAEPEICNNRFEGNDFGVQLWNSASANVHNNVMINNTYTAIKMSSLALVVNNTVANNGRGIWGDGWGNSIVMNNISTGNALYGIGTGTGWPSPIISYNDVWGNGTNYQNCAAGPGDISANPLYVDEPGSDFHLQAGSPCIDAGNPAPAYNDPDGSRNDMGAYGGPGANIGLPQVSLTTPSQNELNVLYNTVVSAVFTVDMNASTFTPLTFTLNGYLTGSYPGTVTYDGPTKMATIDPNNDFKYGEVVTAVLTTDIESSSGTPFTGYAWQFTSKVEGGSGVYMTPTNYSVANNPNAVITGDFDTDGNLDLGAVNVNSNNVSIRLGNGGGTFGSLSNYSTGTSPYALCTSDFDGDGNLDLAVTNGGSNNVSILLGNGDGTFGAATNFSAGTLPNAICSGDFNFDDDLDLAVANASSNNVSILLGNGDGTFGSPSNFSVGTSPYSVCTGDFDNNGILDLVTANGGSNNVSILLGNGDGSFGAASNYSAGTSPYALCTGDFDSDGVLDLAVANGGFNNVSVLIGNGDGSFGSATNYSTGTTPYSVVTSDFDGDGYLDLVTANEGTDDVSVLLGDGDGTFGAATNYSTGNNPHSVTCGDFDGDGDIDLCTANYNDNNLSILLNEDALLVVSTNPFQYQLDVPKSTNASGTFNKDVNAPTVNSSTFTLFGEQSGPHPGTVTYNGVTFTATFDPTTDFVDGEIVTAFLSKGIQANSGVYLRGFSWNFTAEITTPSDGTFADPQNYSTGIEPRGMYVGDLDADSDIDIAVTSNQNVVSVLLNNGDGTFSGPTNYALGQSGPMEIYGGDLDGDGDIDLATAHNEPGSSHLVILKNNGNGTFTLFATYTPAVLGQDVCGGDIDSDGDIDLVMGDSWGTNPCVLVMKNNGNGTFSGPYAYTTGLHTRGLRARDLDNDGDIDIAVADNATSISVLMNDGKGNFPILACYPIGDYPTSLYINDFNGDGYTDIAAASYSGDNVKVILNNGDGTFSSAASYSTGSNTRFISGGDFDGDGDIDLTVSINGADSVSVILNNGDGTFANLAKYQVEQNPWGIQAADFDLDGDLDIACANINSDNVTILFNTGPLNIEASAFTATSRIDGIEIRWRTESENEIYQWIIERKESADYKEIGRVDGEGNSNSPQEYIFLDRDVVYGHTYTYRLFSLNNSGNKNCRGSITVQFSPPYSRRPKLYPISPNPVRLNPQITFSIPKKAFVSLKVYDISGRQIETVVNETKEAGVYNIKCPLKKYPQGIYFIEFRCDSERMLRKITFIR